jgi:hypothetical protein
MEMMRRAIGWSLLAVLGSAALALGSLGGRPAATAEPPPRVGPAAPADMGKGEMLILVVGGVYGSRDEALTANEAMPFGELQGYYVVPVAAFEGLREQLGSPGDWALVSAFRTEEGARGFAELAASMGHPATILPNRVQSLGLVFAGLGQEADPDGSGPLLEPVPESLP